MDVFNVFKDLAIIIVFAKLFGIVARRFKAPQVVGEIIAGLIIGPSLLGIVSQTEFLKQMAEIGVVLLMFLAGLDTDLDELKKTGPIAFLVACAGVFIPLIGGTLLYMAFYGFAGIGSEEFYKALFIGVIMTATSVSITVEALRDLGKLRNKVGTTILSAAIIDDVIGIIVLTVVVGFKNPSANPKKVILNTILFFVFAIVVGFIIYKVFKEIDARYPKTRRLSILGLALCLFMAYVAEKYFGVADVTGAYVAGIILSNISDSSYIAKKLEVNSYMFFSPIFFASIGLKTNITNINSNILLFSLGFVVVALICKIIGCGFVAKMCKFNGSDSLKIGIGMMTRGEVALIVAQKGLSIGLLSPIYFTSVILLIITSSIITPILLKIMYAKDEKTAAQLSVQHG